jgi:Flp pilus assembly protein CpaB
MHSSKESERTSGFVVGLLIGALVSFVLLSVFGGAAGWMYVKRKAREARAGWTLVPVVVANQDIPAGSQVTYQMVSRRVIPEQFVTGSVVKTDKAADVIGTRTLRPMAAGDPVLWTNLASRVEDDECRRMCEWVSEANAKADGGGHALNVR